MFRAITGPTGAGKTRYALHLISGSKLQLLNADAFQFYREIPVLSNQEPLDQGVLFRAHRSLSEPWSAGEFARATETYLDAPVLWVGTGLYICSALYGLDSDGRKGTPFQGAPKRDFRMLVVDEERSQLYEKLDRRVEQMLESGAELEARKIFEALESGVLDASLPALKAIGLRHLLEHYRGDYSRERAIELWKRDSRRLAKRQWTWLRKFCPPSEVCLWLRGQEIESQPDKVSKFLEI